jgi:integrase
MLSYYLAGINLIDLLSYDFRNKKIMEYIRTKTRNKKKTNRTVSFSIPDEAMPIIHRYMSPKTGRLDFGQKGTYDTFKNIVTRDIKRIAKKLGIRQAEKVCYYTARKSFVQHGFDLGISLEVLEYCIGQSMKSNRPIFNYLKIMRRHADTAMRKIFDGLK